MLPYILFLLLFYIRPISGNNGLEKICNICLPSSTSEILIISEEKCFKPDKNIFVWPPFEDNPSCNYPTFLSGATKKVRLDAENFGVSVRKKECQDLILPFKVLCKETNAWNFGTLRVKIDSRKKRWLRRRNHKVSPIHFQQDRYVTEIPENIPIKTIIAKISATHERNQPLYYSMLAPEDSRSSDLFSLDTTNGDISIAKALDRETLAKHVLKVTVYERLDPSVSISTTVIVNVLDVQDNTPVFEKNSYFAEIREDALIETTVLSVFARDLDDGINGEIEYSLAEGPGSDLLKINPISGVISTQKLLDRENISFIRLNVVATDKGIPSMSSQALIEITVTDVNDNVPEFEQKFYNITVFENVTIPSIIAKIVANDADSGANGKVHYSIVTTSTTDLFYLDYNSGELSIRQIPLPRQSPLSLLIRAKDEGQPHSHSATVHCQVNIIDVNDHSPTFIVNNGNDGHVIHIEENISKGKEIGRLYAVDEDFGKNGEITYEILNNEEGEEENNGEFVIDSITGALKTTVTLDRETKEKYKLKIMAKDNGNPSLNSTADLTIIIKDLNDNSPKFEHGIYNLTLSESTARGKKLMQIYAKDADSDSKIFYKIEEMPRKLFALVNLGEQGAILSLAQEFAPLDQEMDVIISATDQGGLQGRCIVHIRIDDVNSPPMFIENPVSVRIPENSPIGFHVLKMRAEDSDHRENAKLQFSIDSEKFMINPSSGLITVAKPLDREEQSLYAVSIEVSDSGEPPMSSSTVLEILLDDVNDNAPEFTEAIYEVRINENIAVGTSFLQLKAIDLDEGSNGIINYFLNETDATVELDHFRLDQTSGILRVNRPLDREKIESYILPIVAIDRGEPPQKTFTSVTIFLNDINDNAPQFEKGVYDFWIAENSPPGTVVGSLRAIDPDEGDNAKLEFRIFGGQDAKLFDIENDPNQEGVVRILSRTEFDYEAKINKFSVELQASSGQLSSTVPVKIHVSDVNDNRPQLKDFLVLISTFETDTSDISIGSVPAFDPDHNATLEHYLEENDVISVEEFSGRFSLKATFRRQINMEQKACVSDGPNTECSRAQIVYISVNEEALRQSVTLQLHDITIDEFLDYQVYRRFLDSLTSVSSKWIQENFRIFSIKLDDSSDSLHVSFFVSVDDNILSLRKVEETILENVRNLSALFGFKVSVVHDELCYDEPCPYYQKCRRSLKYVKNSKLFESENFIMRSLDTIRTFTCECPQGFTTNENLPGQCNQRLDLCYDSPCMNNGTCVPLESGYRCECTPDRTGEKCEFAISETSCTPFTCQNGAECHLLQNQPICRYCQWPKPDADESCRLRAVSFAGNGYLVIPKAPARFEWEISVDIATISSTGIILYAGDKRKGDFLELSLESGVPKAEMSLGGENKVVIKAADWPENRLNNGEWHTIKLTYVDKRLRLAVDDCDAHLSLTMSRKIGYKHCAVEAIFELPTRCIDPAVPCHRSFDLQSSIILGNRPTSHNSDSKQNSGFIGCVRDFHLNKKFIDFSEFKSFERSGDVVAGCQRYRPDKCEFEKPCDGGSKCVNKWIGHLCQCPHRSDMKAPSCALETTSTSLSLFSEEAYSSWRLPSHIRYPLTMFFEFRTRERKTQVIALEFELKSQVFIFSLENGHGLVQIDAEQYFIPFPQLSDAQWHSVEVHFTAKKVEISIDKHYQKTFSFVSETSLSIPQQLYSGQAPSTSYPHVFLGCIRNVELNKIKLKPLESSQTRPGCQVPNACSSETKICPRSSTCVRDWDRHNCFCKKGYAGDSCVDICSIEGICQNEGLCIRSNSSRGYDCLCPEGFRGQNCERKVLPKTCPSGWFGVFPKCEKCACQTRRGFKHYCDRLSGQCICQPGTYQEKGHCKPCECGFGSSSALCDAVTGQCPCSGESSGRRCDRCRLSLSFLDRKTLKCVKLKDRCPTEIEEGIQWPSTLRGGIARQSCPGNQMGIATRKCSNGIEWQTVSDYNCTLPQLYDLNAKVIGKFDAFDVGRQLLNFTSDFAFVKNRNIDLAIGVFEKVVVTEAKNSLTVSRQHSRHVRDSQFTKNIVEIIDALLDYNLNEGQFQQLMIILYDYGVLLTSVHEAALYLKPFQVVRQNLLFAIDKLDSRKYPSNSFNLPKYDQFAPPEFEMEKSLISNQLINLYHSHKVNLYGPENFATSTAFYSIIPRARCQGCEHSLILVSHLTAAEPELHPEVIQVTFKSDDGIGWRLPECVWLDFESDLLAQHGLMASKEYGMMEKLSNVFKTDWNKAESANLQWRSDHAVLIGLNSTHITCQYHLVAGGIFTVLVKSDGSAIQFSLYSGGMPLTSPLLAILSLLLCIASVLILLLRRHVRIRFIRILIAMSFILNAIILFATQKITMSTSFCAFRNASLTFAISFLFSWLFIYSLHIYHLLAEGHPTPCISICILIGIVLPSALSVANFFILPSCSFSSTSPAFWLMLSPMIIFLLLNFYALATSFLISLSKQYNIVASKVSLKRTLLTHTFLTLCCTVYNGMTIYFFVIGRQTTFPEIFSNISLFIASGVLCFSSTLMNFNEPEKPNEKNSLWNNQTFSPTDPTATLPLLESSKKNADRVYDGPPGEWMPDVIPSETYVHHTLQRSLQLGNPMTPIRRMTPPQIPQILSPAQKVFGGPIGCHGSTFSIGDDGTRSTLPRELLTTPTSAHRKLFFSGSATVSRSGSLASHSTMPSQHGGNKFSIAQMDQMDDAYYTYSSSTRFQPQSTFR